MSTKSIIGFLDEILRVSKKTEIKDESREGCSALSSEVSGRLGERVLKISALIEKYGKTDSVETKVIEGKTVIEFGLKNHEKLKFRVEYKLVDGKKIISSMDVIDTTLNGDGVYVYPNGELGSDENSNVLLELTTNNDITLGNIDFILTPDFLNFLEINIRLVHGSTDYFSVLKNYLSFDNLPIGDSKRESVLKNFNSLAGKDPETLFHSDIFLNENGDINSSTQLESLLGKSTVIGSIFNWTKKMSKNKTLIMRLMFEGTTPNALIVTYGESGIEDSKNLAIQKLGQSVYQQGITLEKMKSLHDFYVDLHAKVEKNGEDSITVEDVVLGADNDCEGSLFDIDESIGGGLSITTANEYSSPLPPAIQRVDPEKRSSDDSFLQKYGLEEMKDISEFQENTQQNGQKDAQRFIKTNRRDSVYNFPIYTKHGAEFIFLERGNEGEADYVRLKLQVDGDVGVSEIRTPYEELGDDIKYGWMISTHEKMLEALDFIDSLTKETPHNN